MNPLDDSLLNSLLNNDGQKVFADESDIVEYKQSFDWASKENRSKYSKSFAAFCNNKGGYLFFGIDDSKTIIGISDFENTDMAHISDHLNNYFSPSIKFSKRSFTLQGKELGVIYIERYSDIPTICIKEHDPKLRDGAIYYRYPGKSDYINGKDLINFIHNIKAKDTGELVNLKKIELKQASLPIFKFDGGNSAQSDFSINLINVGSRGKVTSVNILHGDFYLTGKTYPRTVEKNESLIINATNSKGNPASMSTYEIEILFDDFVGNSYKMTGMGQGASIRFSEPVNL